MCTHGECSGEDPEDPNHRKRADGFPIDQHPACPLILCLALQHLLVQSSLILLVVGLLAQSLWLQDGERDHLMASSFFHSGVSTLLQSWVGTRLPLIQAPSLEFVIPAIALSQLGFNLTQTTCIGACIESQMSLKPSDPMRELQGMSLICGLVQFVLGASGLSGWVLQHCGPLVLGPLLCVIGCSIYKEAAVLCSDQWVIAVLTMLLIVFLSRHLNSWCFLILPKGNWFPFCRMTSVLLPLLGVWALCATLEHYDYFHPHLASDLLFALRPINSIRNTLPQQQIMKNSSQLTPWLSFPLRVEKLPLLSRRGIAAGTAAALSSTICSQGVYILTGRLLRAQAPPPDACSRGLCAEGIGSVSASLLGCPLGVSSSVANACTVGLSQCGSRRTVQLAAVLGLMLGLSPRLSGLLVSTPLAIHGAVLSVTYSVAMGTGVSYFQYTHIDSGRNIFNIGFAMFMALVVPRWFNINTFSMATGVPSLDVLLQSLLTLPVFIVGLLAFFLDNTVSGSLSERGLSKSAVKKRALDEMVCLYHTDSARIYDPPHLLQKVMDLPGLRVVPFCACRHPVTKETVMSPQETSDLLDKFKVNKGRDL